MRDPAALSRTARKARTRDVLKQAARSCFARRGYHETQIGDIARAAGVAQGTMYVHFASKEAVLDELLAELDAELLARLQSAWASLAASAAPGHALDLAARVRVLASECLAVWHDHRELLRAFAERATLGLDVRRLHDGVSPGSARWVRELLERATSELGLALPHPELVGHALLGLWMRVGLFSLFDETVPRAELAELLTRLTLGAIGGVATPTPTPALPLSSSPRPPQPSPARASRSPRRSPRSHR